MARIRTIKPDLFKHERLFDLEQSSGLPVRLAFPGLWTQCDREGRFKWRPRQLKTEILPYDEVDFARVLDALASGGFVVKYSVGPEDYGYIPSWKRHQVINNRESESTIPPPAHTSGTRDGRVDDACPTPLKYAQAEGKGKEGKGKEGGRIEPPPFGIGNSENPPHGLTPHQYANGILTNLGVPASNTITHLAAQAVESVSNREKVALHIAAARIISRGKYDQSGGVTINRFWFDDQKFNAQTPDEMRVPQPKAPEIALNKRPEGLNVEAGRKAWADATAKLAACINKHSFDTWIKPLRAEGLKGDVLYVRIPTPEFKHIGTKYNSDILAALPERVKSIELLTLEASC